MGLDQYLTKKTYVKNWNHEAIKWDITVLRGGEPSPIKKERISYVEEEIHYWRKANHIHKWFVDNCQDGEDDCRSAYVSREQLQELVDLLEKVAANHDLAGELLPVQEGFFFGSNEYDEYYFKKNDETIKVLKEELAIPEKEQIGSYEYTSSW